MEIEEEFSSINSKDLWVYNKLQLSKLLNYNCGPAGMKVHSSGLYIVRPSVNFMGMGKKSRIVFLESSTEHLHPGEFWCEIFKGEHLSVDFINEKSVLVVKGHRNVKNSLSRWNCWSKVSRIVEFPSILKNLVEDYTIINCEFIGNKLIEVHFRPNPDFRYGNSIAIPVWRNETSRSYKNFNYIEDSDADRLGFWIK
jgi:hypothetical protein